MIPGITGPDGEVHQYKPHNPGRSERFYVNADVSDEHLVDVLEFLEFCYFSEDKDVAPTLVFGEKGVDWKWDDNGEDPVVINVLSNNERGVDVFSRNMVFGDPYRWTLMEEPFHSGVEYYIEDFGGIWNKMQRYTYKADVANETEASSISAEYGADWEALRKEYYLNVIMVRSLEEGWDIYRFP